MISWQTAQSLLLFFGPWLVPKLLAWYRSIKTRPASLITPLPQKTSYALGLLFLSGLIAFLSTLPLFAPENIFQATHSRLHTSAGVLLTRLAALRPLTPEDEHVRTLFDAGGLDIRLLYLLFGPSVTLHNPLAKAGDIDASRGFLLYAIPSLLYPHLLHLFILGLATSPTLLFNKATWRTPAVISGLALVAAETYYVATYSHLHNSRSSRATDMDFAFWKLRIYRGLAIACLDAVLGWIIYLQSTGRAFIVPVSPSERFADHATELEKLFAKARGLGVLRNATVRDADSRGKVEDYWRKEAEVMKDVGEEPEVLEAQRNALKRLDMSRVGRDAESFIDSVLGLAPSNAPSGAAVADVNVSN